ncbi:hypothetical protein [Streptomyces sp. NPDC012510]|uniref:hypothetical protein n=1 Tax=Streptomyces sp. NPDC012510 TaxID=3364838 RepID=UPI0036F06A9D
MVPLFTGTAEAASTLGASMEEKGHHFGAAVGTFKFSENTHVSVLNREFPIPLPWRTGLLTQTNSPG